MSELDPPELKEGILLDKDGTPILYPEHGSHQSEGPNGPRRMRTFTFNSLSLPFGSIFGTMLAVVLIFGGLTVIAVALAAFLVFWLLRSLWQILGLQRPSPRDSRRYPGRF